MPEFTAKNWPIASAPARVTLRGDKTRQAEAAQHVIEFPGGAIELTRTANDEYWAHIIVNRGPYLPDEWHGRLGGARGEIVDSRVDTPDGILDVPGAAQASQIAVRIRTGRPATQGAAHA